MSLLKHYVAVNSKHFQLKKQIEEAYTHNEPDTEIARLKKLKLRLKDEKDRIKKAVKNMLSHGKMRGVSLSKIKSILKN